MIIFFLWLFTGGPQHYEQTNGGRFIKPLPPLNTGETYDLSPN